MRDYAGLRADYAGLPPLKCAANCHPSNGCREIEGGTFPPVERLPERSRHRAHGCPQIGGRERRRAAWLPEILGGRVCETRREQARQGGKTRQFIRVFTGVLAWGFARRVTSAGNCVKRQSAAKGGKRARRFTIAHPFRRHCEFMRDKRDAGGIIAGRGTKSRDYSTRKRDGTRDNVPRDRGRANCHPSGGMAGEIGTGHRSRAHPLNRSGEIGTGRTASGTGTRARRTLAATRPADADARAGGCRPVSGELSNRPARSRAGELLNRHPSNGCRTSRKPDAGEIGTAHRRTVTRPAAWRARRCRLSNRPARSRAGELSPDLCERIANGMRTHCERILTETETETETETVRTYPNPKRAHAPAHVHARAAGFRFRHFVKCLFSVSVAARSNRETLPPVEPVTVAARSRAHR